MIASSGVEQVSMPIDELPVASERVLHSVPGDGADHSALDVEEPGRPCALSGRVLELGALCDIVSFIAQAVWRGELVVATDEATRSLFFDEGHVVAAESSAPSECLGEVLCGKGVLTREQVVAAADLAAKGELRFGEAAVSLGFVTREALFDSMALQIEEIFGAVLRVDRGTFVFFHGYEEARLSFRKKHEVEPLIVRAIAGIDDLRYFRSRIPSDDHVPVRTAGRTLPAGDPLGVYEAIDGSRSVSELARAVESTPLEVTRALFQHVQTGHASVRGPRLGALEVLEIYNKAILVLLRELDAMDEGDAVRDELTSFAEHRSDRPSFVDAPAEDGTLDAETIASHVDAADDPKEATERLARWLYDYASYALFLARPHLHRRDQGRAQPRVSQRVAEMLEAIAPRVDVALPPVQGALRVTVPAPSAPSSSGTHQRAKTADGEPPRIASTVRMRRVLPDVLPGLDPSRTVRMAPFTMSTELAPPSVPLVAAPPSVGPVSMRQHAPPVEVVATSASSSPVSTAAEAARRRPQALLLLAALLGAGAVGWLGHRLLTPEHRAEAATTSEAASPPPAATPEMANTTPAPSPVTELVVVCEPRCGAVYVDGKKSSSSDAIAVTAGAHDVAVRTPGYSSEYRRVVVADGESRAVTFQLTPHGNRK